MHKVSPLNRLRYWFDNLMSKGTVALIGWIALVAFTLVLTIALTSWTLEGRPIALIDKLWQALLTALVGFDSTGGQVWIERVSNLLIILINFFLVSMVTGLIVTAVQEKIFALQRGRSTVIDANHTVILGWSEQVFSILSELVTANQNQAKSTIVVLGEKDKVEMEEEIRTQVKDSGRTRIICRQGKPTDMAAHEIVSLNTAKSIIVLSPEQENPDTSVIKTLLAIFNNPKRKSEPYHIVTEIKNHNNYQIAKIVGQDEVEVVLTGNLIARVIAQICRQPGLSVVYTELLNFSGDEIYDHNEPQLTGKTFGEALFAYETSTVIGLYPSGGQPKLNPPMDTPIQQGDRLIVIAADDDTIRLSGLHELGILESAICTATSKAQEPEQFLILGWNSWGTMLMGELDGYVPAGSVVTIVAQDDAMDATQIGFKNLEVVVKPGDSTDRQVLDSLGLEKINHVILLSYTDSVETEQADAIVLTTLLHLRDIAKQKSLSFSLTSQIMDVRNQTLAQIAQVDDFIVGDQLTSLMLSQIAENKFLSPVIADLLDSEGSELYLKPAEDYVVLGKSVNFYTVVEAARRRGEVALGYRRQAAAQNPNQDYGVAINPAKSNSISFTQLDQIIVLSEA